MYLNTSLIAVLVSCVYSTIRCAALHPAVAKVDASLPQRPLMAITGNPHQLILVCGAPAVLARPSCCGLLDAAVIGMHNCCHWCAYLLLLV